MSRLFQLSDAFKPRGDQEQAIAKLTESIKSDNRHQTLLGVTGSGKTFSMASIVANVQLPTLVLSHNKTLAAQLYSEFKNFFPHNAVEYFVSYFDYYQPEAYIPRTDTYIEKDSSINDEIERLRLSTMGSLLCRQDTLVVASVSCIYGLGSPEDYSNMIVPVHVGMTQDRDAFLKKLVEILYQRNDFDFERGKFRARGDVVEVFPAYLDNEAIRVEFWGDEIERVSAVDPLTGKTTSELDSYAFYPAKQFVTSKDKIKIAIGKIRAELEERVAKLESKNKLIEAQRIKMRTDYDIEMLQEMGFCQGIENYSRHLTGRKPGQTPYTLLDFFPENFLTLIDESHASIPQLHAMHAGDRARKTVLVEHGFRLPSALDNRPLNFEEFMRKSRRNLYVSATPGAFEYLNSYVGNDSYIPHAECKEIYKSSPPPDISAFDTEKKDAPLIAEQVIRPTGLLDPVIEIKPLRGQIDATIELCRKRIAVNERVLVTTLTKQTAEDLTDYLLRLDLKVRYIHADVDAIERVEILRSLREGSCDVLVGINLLREGLDLPEVSLVCILDADKEGYLRNETSLMQTSGRAARHEHGKVVLFADRLTKSIKRLLKITTERRLRQEEFNEKHDITPRSVIRREQSSLHTTLGSTKKGARVAEDAKSYANADEAKRRMLIAELEEEMLEASRALEFERAALLRDQLKELRPEPVTLKKI